MDLDALFTPSSVAVVGASATPGKIGHTIVANLREAGFTGEVFPVNPKGGEIEGLTAYASVGELPRAPDLGVVVVPRRLAIDALRELGESGCKAAIVITAGFKEVGKRGYHLEEELIQVASEHSMAMLGPNCLGLINTENGLNASFAAARPPKGNIAFFSQSGALCVAILDWARGENIGFSKFVSLGNKAVISETDMLDHLADDPATDVILGYVENIGDGMRFLETAQMVARKKPIIMIKSGTTTAGAKAASSHTGAMAGSDQAYETAFRKAGIIRVRSVEHLFNLAQAFASQPLPKGANLTIVTNSGGPGILAADAAEKAGLNLPRPSSATLEKLGEFLPTYASLYNPIDIIGDADADRYERTLEAVAGDESVHSLLVVLTPTASVEIEETAQAVIDVARESSKPVFACFMGKDRVAKGQRMLVEAGVPCYAFPEPAVESVRAMFSHFQRIQKPEPVGVCINRETEDVRRVIADARRWGVHEIVEFQAQDILKAYNLPLPRTILARSSDEAGQAAEEIGLPVVVKIASAQISHKSDVQGVKAGLKTSDEVRAAFREITNRAQRLRPEAYINGCLVQAMAPEDCKEVIVGFTRDDQFGPLLLFGLGGIYVEILKDVAFRLAPLGKDDARDIIREVKAYMLLKGFRGEPPVNFEALEHIILIMSQLAMDFPEIVEAEFNPVLVNDRQALVADVRLSLGSRG
ncbi:acetate--CoA ligase alpha subunit [Desulfohalovibrio reitneri]|uniref:acetate--CoA ligase alpha subunit n=1 Tax=Desulfohalovibrio reitneri TaxID=1307759 RepID=UPI0004A6BE4C|nr:acetate--CoA ligase [Desulfohalovibrio reitneri]